MRKLSRQILAMLQMLVLAVGAPSLTPAFSLPSLLHLSCSHMVLGTAGRAALPEVGPAAAECL